MTSMTVRLADDKYQRLKAVAHRRGTSVNRLFDEMATVILAESDAATHFQLRSDRGAGKAGRGLELLDKAMGESGAGSN
jgi:predicted transcriptional regulator